MIEAKQGPNISTYNNYIEFYVKDKSRVLDFGSANHSEETSTIGTRSAHEVICQNNKVVIAVDIEEHTGKKFMNAKYFQTNLFDPKKSRPSEIGKVEVLFAGNVIEHLESPGNLFELAKDVLVYQGEIIITTVNPVWAIGVYDRINIGYQSNCVDHTVLIGVPEILEYANRFDLTLEEWNYIGKIDMTKRFEPGGKVLGRLIGLAYRFARHRDLPFAYNLVGFRLRYSHHSDL
jgi:hypothetical protein